jgi:hypothetical protein
VLLKAAADRWGRKGANGGHVTLVAAQQALPGDLLVGDSISSIDAILKEGSTLTGSVHGASLTLDATTKWIVKDDSALTWLADDAGLSGTAIANIVGNGHTVTYNPKDSHNDWLKGKSYALAGGGKLVPEGSA